MTSQHTDPELIEESAHERGKGYGRQPTGPVPSHSTLTDLR